MLKARNARRHLPLSEACAHMLCAHLTSHDLRNGLPFDDRLLPLVSRHPVVVVAEIRAFHVSQELLVMGDDNELEVGLLPPHLDDVVKRFRKGADVVAIQIRRRLVERDQPAVDAEALSQGQPDDDTCQHLLSSTTSATHIHFGVLLDHAHPIVVRVARVEFHIFTIRADEDGVNVRPLISPLPQLFDDTVDLFHLKAVIFHDCST